MIRCSSLNLAWRNLTHRKRRLTVSALGIAFAVILMCMEVGFRNALFDSQLALVRGFNADLILCSKAKFAMSYSEPFPRSRLYQARSVGGVAAAYPVYIEKDAPLWHNREDSTTWSIRVVAFNPDDPVFLDPVICRQAEALKEADTVLMDVRSRSFYGKREPGTVTELSRRSVVLAGTFSLGTDFNSNGTLLMSDKNYLKFFPDSHSSEPNLARVELGLLKVDAGADPRRVRAALVESLPADVKVLTREEFLDQEVLFWEVYSPIGPVFALGAVLGFVVGVIICYQILFTDVVDHLPQFATLKAIGYSGGFLVRVVLGESLCLALLGFVPGLVLSAVLYALVDETIGLPMVLTVWRGGLVLALTVVMCMLSGLIAVRKVVAADPADVF